MTVCRGWRHRTPISHGSVDGGGGGVVGGGGGDVGGGGGDINQINLPVKAKRSEMSNGKESQDQFYQDLTDRVFNMKL
ncbi:Hypothetical predicted protein [Octopus vulgaris]|uniref:Uncharacterized protein n=1 Tax=Octopus vulgaris TaxID=6645 RepID=A0AA36BM96_OCTVU|nr:Hypothetical predicted protein [Octopus vulgaris]